MSTLDLHACVCYSAHTCEHTQQGALPPFSKTLSWHPLQSHPSLCLGLDLFSVSPHGSSLASASLTFKSVASANSSGIRMLTPQEASTPALLGERPSWLFSPLHCVSVPWDPSPWLARKSLSADLQSCSAYLQSRALRQRSQVD